MTFRSISLPSSLTVDSWAASVTFMPSTRAMTAFASASTLRDVHQGFITNGLAKLGIKTFFLGLRMNGQGFADGQRKNLLLSSG